MITIYQKQKNCIKAKMLEDGMEIPNDSIWIDAQALSEEQLKALEKQLNIQIPSKKEVWKNQVLNRFYIKNNIAYMTAAIITKVDAPHPKTIAFTFIVTDKYLLTLHEITPTSFNNFSQRLQRSNENFTSSTHLFLGLLEEVIYKGSP